MFWFSCIFFFSQPLARNPSGLSEGLRGINLDLLIQKMCNVCLWKVQCYVLGAGSSGRSVRTEMSKTALSFTILQIKCVLR